jgi:hypothetical protein
MYSLWETQFGKQWTGDISAAFVLPKDELFYLSTSQEHGWNNRQISVAKQGHKTEVWLGRIAIGQAYSVLGLET